MGINWRRLRSDLVTNLVPIGASMAYDKITGLVLDKTLLM